MDDECNRGRNVGDTPTEATVQRHCEAQLLSIETRAFFDALEQHLGLAPGSGPGLASERPFSGPDGLICRIETQRDGAQLMARPQLVLPLDGADIERLELLRVLSLQRVLLQQLGWVLGASSEGLLQLSPLAWAREAEDVARDLDLGTAVGRIVLTMLCDPEAPRMDFESVMIC